MRHLAKSFALCEGKTGTFCISAGAWTWTQAFSLSVDHENSKNVECPDFVSVTGRIKRGHSAFLSVCGHGRESSAHRSVMEIVTT